jgi:RHS repeat-associated protein
LHPDILWHRKPGPGRETLPYDGNGNQTQAGTRSFSWDLANRLAATTDAGATTTYGYDGDGTRLQATVGASTTNYLWDSNVELPQLALERDGAGSPLRSYLHGNQLVSMVSGGSAFYYQRDGLGSIVNLTSASGVPQWTYSYEPYGSARTQTQHDPGAPDNPIRFAGEQLDPTGLYHLRARQYNPADGRFLTVDPLSPTLTDPYTGAYAYTNNRPTALLDPSGKGAVRSSGSSCGMFLCRVKSGAERIDQLVEKHEDTIKKVIVVVGATYACYHLGMLAFEVSLVSPPTAPAAVTTAAVACGLAAGAEVNLHGIFGH